MPSGYTYTVLDKNLNPITGFTNVDFQLNQNGKLDIKVTGQSGTLTLQITDDKGTTTTAATTTCVELPDLTAVGVCTGQTTAQGTFTVKNNGGAMNTAYKYEVKDNNGKVVQSGIIQLGAGASQQIVVNGIYGELTLHITDSSNVTTQLSTMECTGEPEITVSGICSMDADGNPAQIKFTITNTGGDMTTEYAYAVTDGNGNVVDSGTFKLNANGSTTVTVSGSYTTLTLSVIDDNEDEVTVSTATCSEIPEIPAAEPTICIQCLIFHTFRDDNLEIYRLDGVEGQPGFKLYNLSQHDAVDSRPSRAPNDSYVVFQSNRDGNVELYYTDLLGSGEATRLTNTNSNNTNPMYGPNARLIVFQSDRNGNMDLFTIDQVTKKETQITSDPADDINGFWSPDLRWLVFQSDRNDNWDLFILDVQTGNEYQLTDSPADEVFPAWSSNGKQIAFLSTSSTGGTDLYIINTDGSGLKRITTDGRTQNAVWSPEGNRIAYQSERNGNLDIYSYDVKAGKEYHVTDYEGLDSGPTWDCGGTNLAFTSDRDGDPTVFQVFWQGGEAGNMTIDPATDKWSQWRPSNDVSSVGY